MTEECRRIVITVPNSLIDDVDTLADADGLNRSEVLSKALKEYINRRKAKLLRQQLKNGYKDMAAINIEWAEGCLCADNQCQSCCEEKLSECE